MLMQIHIYYISMNNIYTKRLRYEHISFTFTYKLQKF